MQLTSHLATLSLSHSPSPDKYIGPLATLKCVECEHVFFVLPAFTLGPRSDDGCRTAAVCPGPSGPSSSNIWTAAAVMDNENGYCHRTHRVPGTNGRCHVSLFRLIVGAVLFVHRRCCCTTTTTTNYYNLYFPHIYLTSTLSFVSCSFVAHTCERVKVVPRRAGSYKLLPAVTTTRDITRLIERHFDGPRAVAIFA